MSAWEATMAGGLSLSYLRGAARAVPHSELARIFALLSLSEASFSRAATVDGKNIIRVQLVALLRVHVGGDELADEMVRVAYNVHHPMNGLNPEHSEDVGKRVAHFSDDGTFLVPAHLPLVPTDRVTQAYGTSVACPIWASQSCFSDSLFVVMFIATDKYDRALLARSPPPSLRSTSEEAGLTSVADEILNVCNDPLEFVDRDARFADDADTTLSSETRRERERLREAARRLRLERSAGHLRDTARAVAWGMRAAPTPAEPVGELQARVGIAMTRFREAMDKCVPGFDFATQPNEPLEVYHRLLAMTGWGRWYMSVPVSVGHLNDESGRGRVHLDMSANVESGVYIRLSGPMNHVGPVPIQDAVDFSIGKIIDEKGSVYDINYLPSPPASGILVLQVPFYFNLTTFQRMRVELTVPDDRVIAVPFGRPGDKTEQRIRFRVFAVIMYEGASGSEGHYTCYFWRNDILFFYDDGAASVPVAVSDYKGAQRRITRNGINFFLEAIAEDSGIQDDDASGFDSDSDAEPPGSDETSTD